MHRLLILISVATIAGGFSLPFRNGAHVKNLDWLLTVSQHDAASKNHSTLCETDECKRTAQVIKAGMDDTVDPCDDFYEYACGNWPNNYPLPEGHDSWGLWDMMYEYIQSHTKNTVQSELKQDDILPVRLAKKWYKTCMDIDAMERMGVNPALSTLFRHGGWPMIMEEYEWAEVLYPWQKVDEYYSHLTGQNALFDVRAVVTEEYGSLIIIHEPHFPPRAHSLVASPRFWDEDDTSNEDEQEDESNESASWSEEEDKKSHTEQPEESEEESEEETTESSDLVHRRRAHKVKGRKSLVHSRKTAHEQRLKRTHPGKHATKKRVKRVKRELTKSRIHQKLPGKIHPSNLRKTMRKIKMNGKKTNKQVNTNKVAKVAKSKHYHKNKHGNHYRVTMNKVHAKNKYRRVENDGTENGNDEDEEEKGNESGNESKNNSGNKSDEKDNDGKDEDDKDDDGKDDDGKDGDDKNDDGKDDDDKDDDGKNDDDDDDEDDNEEEDSDDDDSDDDSHEEYEALLAKRREQYTEYISRVALIMAEARGIKISEEKLKTDVENLVQFQIQLYVLTFDYEDYDNLTLRDFQEKYDSFEPKTQRGKINWIRTIQGLFLDAGVEVDEEANIIVTNPKYIKGLVALLDETPSETIVNYIHWNALSRAIHGTTRELRNLTIGWREPRAEGDTEEIRTAICLKEVEMSDIVAYEYVRQYFSEETVKVATDMIDEIQKEVEYQIKESTWMDDFTKDFILDKLINMKKIVGYPDWYRNETIVKQYFQGLVIGPSYFENIFHYLRYNKWQEFRQLLSEEVADTWLVDPLMLNAFFMPTENSITVTAADFEFPMFAYNRPQGINFGVIGFVMAHEVNHGFDDSGHLYDKNGDVMEWLTAMAEAYNERAECFVDQFNGYSILKGDNETIEDYGNQTAGENIADSMGLQAVYRAYKRRERECGRPDELLPGLEKFTSDQIFFLSFANLWCETIDPEAAKIQAMYDEHSPGRLRVIGSVSNSEDFARVYNCPSGSPMNPEKKCNIWK